MDKLRRQLAGDVYCRLLRIAGVQHPGIVFPLMACLFGNRDWFDVFDSSVDYRQEACRRALAVTDRLLRASISLQLHSLADLF